MSSSTSARLATLTSWAAGWRGLRVVVAGIGKTGFSIADTLVELGARVIVVAASTDQEAHRAADTLRIVGVEDVRLGTEASRLLPVFDDGAAELAAELIVTSPGLPPHHPLLRSAEAGGIPIWGDMELAWRLRDWKGTKPADWITITGTNGKTTTTTMTALILGAAGLRTAAVGNIGTPILDAIRDPAGFDVLAVEISSLQLHHVFTVSPVASVCLNIAEDHLDWHGGFDAYLADKARVYERTQLACVYNAEQIETERMVEGAEVLEGCRAIGFSTGFPAISMIGAAEGLLVDRAFLADRRNAAVELAEFSDIGNLVPRHVVANAAAAAALTRAYGVEPGAVKSGLQSFDSGEHRIQPVTRFADVLWINDSKATNPHAAAASLAAFDSVVWIAGGDAKGVGYDELIRLHANRFRAVVLIGRDTAGLRAALARHAPNVPTIEAGPGETGKVPERAAGLEKGHREPEAMMERAVAAAAEFAKPGDTVLLAPAAASIDQFSSYAHRGNAFVDAVQRFLSARTTERTVGQALSGEE